MLLTSTPEYLHFQELFLFLIYDSSFKKFRIQGFITICQHPIISVFLISMHLCKNEENENKKKNTIRRFKKRKLSREVIQFLKGGSEPNSKVICRHNETHYSLMLHLF